jgi:uncharacterized protein YmfQ (DUF2313 family)
MAFSRSRLAEVPFFLASWGAAGLLYLVALVCNLDAHLALNTRYTQAEVRVVKHVDSESDGLGSEVDCESSEQLTSTWESVAKIYQ